MTTKEILSSIFPKPPANKIAANPSAIKVPKKNDAATLFESLNKQASNQSTPRGGIGSSLANNHIFHSNGKKFTPALDSTKASPSNGDLKKSPVSPSTNAGFRPEQPKLVVLPPRPPQDDYEELLQKAIAESLASYKQEEKARETGRMIEEEWPQKNTLNNSGFVEERDFYQTQERTNPIPITEEMDIEPPRSQMFPLSLEPKGSMLEHESQYSIHFSDLSEDFIGKMKKRKDFFLSPFLTEISRSTKSRWKIYPKGRWPTQWNVLMLQWFSRRRTL